jgi:protein-L-isoaspartate(D-aspartate) O-methyltransferase
LAANEALNRLIDTLAREGVTNPRVLDAMRRVDRARFVPEAVRDEAYVNTPLPIGHGQTISQPLVVGLMTQALEPAPTSKVLEIGTGSGYQTAILAELAGRVISVERFASLANRARQTLAELGYANVAVQVGDGSQGWPDDAPYDRIVVTAGAPRIPIHLVARLARDGLMVVPVGTRQEQQLIVLHKGPGGLVEHNVGPVRFVPLIGQGAWSDEGEDG